MPHVQLKCSTCQKKITIDKAAWEKSGPIDAQTMPCVYERDGCSGTMHKFGHILIKRRTIELRPSLDSVLKQNERAKRKRTPASYVEEDEDDEPPRKKFAREEEDDEWLLPVEFNPSMRLTAERMEAARSLSQSSTGTVKTTDRIKIGNAIPGERERKTHEHFNNVSAWRLARNHGAPNANKFTAHKKNHYEYCHLLGVALGGRTNLGNLVAGHYALNTYMMAIESRLQGSGFEVEVTAYCSYPHIADFVKYRVYKSKQTTPFIDIDIDGRITRFSRLDLEELDRQLTVAGLKKRSR